jgi:hypothetical protein
LRSKEDEQQLSFKDTIFIVSDNYFEPTGLPDLGSGALEYGLVPVLGGLLLPIGVPILPRVGAPPETSFGSVPFSGVIYLVFFVALFVTKCEPPSIQHL